MGNINDFQNDLFKKYRKVTYPTVQQNRFLISEDGKLFDTFREKFIKPYYTDENRLRVGISRKNVYIHRLVAWEFCKGRDMTLTVDHVDGNATNNHYTNLEWVTSGENTRRAQAMGLRHNYGELNNTNIYPESLVHEICQMFVEGKTNMDVFYKISQKDKLDMTDEKSKSLYGLIFRLRKRKIWGHITCKYKYDSNITSEKIFRIKENSLFNESDVRRICEFACAGLLPSAICIEMGFDKSDSRYKLIRDNIGGIIRGSTWKYITKEYDLPIYQKEISDKYPYLDDVINDFMDKKYPPQRIFSYFGESQDNNTPLRRAISERIEKYKSMSKIPDQKDLEINENTLED